MAADAEVVDAETAEAALADAEAAYADAKKAEAAARLADLSADAHSGAEPTAAPSDAPTGRVTEVQAEIVLCPWAESLDPADCPALAAAWKQLTPFDQERAAYALVRLLKDTEIGERPDLNRVRNGALAVFSAAYRRLRANQAVTAPLAEDDVIDIEMGLETPNFFAPLVAQIALSIKAKAQNAAVDETPPDDRTLRKILGGLRKKTAAQREQGVRLFKAARRALPDGASIESCCLAASFALLSLSTLSEFSRLELPCPDEWLGRFISFLEEADVVFSGQIGLLVSQERGPVEATVSTAVPSLKTDSSFGAFLRSQNRSPIYDLGMQGWRHVAGDHQDVWSGYGLQAVPIHPDATNLPEPRRGEEGSKLACPATTGQIFGNRCRNCSIKRLRGGCVNRLDRSNGGVAHHQGHLSMHESPVLALLWNAEGLSRREEDVGPGGFPSYLGNEPPPGRPKPGCYVLSRRPCGLPEATAQTVSPAGATPAGGAGQDASEAVRMFQAMVAARPGYTARPIPGAKAGATMLASTAREQALPVADRTLYPITLAGGLAPHPFDRPDLYCFYRFVVPLERVPVQFLAWTRPPGAKAGSKPHPSWDPAWPATADGQAFFRLTEEEQAQALVDYDASPEYAPVPAQLSAVATALRVKRVRTTARAVSRKRPTSVPEPLDDTEDEVEDESLRVLDPSGMLHVIVLNHPQGEHGNAGPSLTHAQDPSFEGSQPWAVSPRRREVVLQEAMIEDALYAKAGYLDESKPIERNLHTDVFKAVARFPQPAGAAYWLDYGKLLRQIVEWLDTTSPGRPEITDISQALRGIPERRSARVKGRLRNFREGPSEAQHLHSYPHGGYPLVPVEVAQVIRDGLSGGSNSALTAERLSRVFAYPVDDFTIEWLLLARFNGGFLPGLAGETTILDASGGGTPVPYDHSYAPFSETVLHLIAHVASGTPVDGEAPHPPSEEAPSASVAASDAEQSGSVGELTSDGEAGAAAGTAVVAGARLASLHTLHARLTPVVSRASAAGPHAEGVGLHEYRPDMARSLWPGRISAPMLLVLGTHTAPSIHLLMEIKYPILLGEEVGHVDKGFTRAGSNGLAECHHVLIDVHVAYPAKEEAALLARACDAGPAQGDEGISPSGAATFDAGGFTGPAWALEPIADHLCQPALVLLPEGTRPSEVAMDSDRRGAAALFLPQCEGVLAERLASLQLQLINRRSSKTKPTAHPDGATQLYQVVC